MKRSAPAASGFGLPISNDYRTSSLTIPSVEMDVIELMGGGEDPLDILCRLEDEHGYVADSDLEALPLR